MYDIGHVKGNHFCMLIFAQGKWKKNYGEKLFEKMQADWLKLESEAVTIEKSPLFNPQKLGKKLQDCKICSAIYESFMKHMKGSNSLVLFSHYVPDELGFKSILTPLMQDSLIQKVYYLEQNSSFYVVPPDQFIAKVKSNLHKQVSIDEFFRLMDFGRFETGVRYEIFRQAPH
ncbi:MAG TPA: hypothetical protein VMV49_09790 [Candidatus Deferrimicrobium sp.]|nr:hypothetical protein [Candidatus Deferrimicrobium sp.]